MKKQKQIKMYFKIIDGADLAKVDFEQNFNEALKELKFLKNFVEELQEAPNNFSKKRGIKDGDEEYYEFEAAFIPLKIFMKLQVQTDSKKVYNSPEFYEDEEETEEKYVKSTLIINKIDRSFVELDYLYQDLQNVENYLKILEEFISKNNKNL